MFTLNEQHAAAMTRTIEQFYAVIPNGRFMEVLDHLLPVIAAQANLEYDDRKLMAEFTQAVAMLDDAVRTRITTGTRKADADAVGRSARKLIDEINAATEAVAAAQRRSERSARRTSICKKLAVGVGIAATIGGGVYTGLRLFAR
jgi:hypothetical protein